jgi:hypothetical protein
LAQLADRAYLEKLQLLYNEFSETCSDECSNELDIFRKAMVFYDIVKQRLQNTLDSTDRFMALHFESRWDTRQNVYQDVISRQKDYLISVLRIPGSDPRNHLKRWKMVEDEHK